MRTIPLADNWCSDTDSHTDLPEISPPETTSTADNEADHDERIRELALLSPIEYDRVRKAEADQLGIRVATLDAAIEGLRPKSAFRAHQGLEVAVAEVEQWADPVDGPSVLAQIADAFCRYVVLPAGAADALALWCAHVHCFISFLCSPRLNIQSPEKGCGKTTLRDVVALFVPRAVLSENMTTAVLFRVIAARAPTILADECDAWLPNNEELRGLLNAGHRRGATVYRCEGDKNEVRAFPAYAPAVLCGIGALPGTLHDRSIVIRLERAKLGELREPYDSRGTKNEQDLCRKLARWIADHSMQLETVDPELPDGVYNRLADNWRPLFAIAQVAGGDWPQRAAAAFTNLTSKGDMDAEGIGTMLLADIRDILARTEGDRLPIADMAAELGKMEDRPWPDFGRGKPITTVKLSRMLKRFGIVSSTMRDGVETFKGYDRGSFTEVFARYLPPTNA